MINFDNKSKNYHDKNRSIDNIKNKSGGKTSFRAGKYIINDKNDSSSSNEPELSVIIKEDLYKNIESKSIYNKHIYYNQDNDIMNSRPMSLACKSNEVNKPVTIFSKKYVELSSKDIGKETKIFLSNKRATLYKTEMCRSFTELGLCKYGDACQFCHHPHELRGVNRHPKYKTEICRTYWLEGSCPYGKRCCFAHHERVNESLEIKPLIKTPEIPAFLEKVNSNSSINISELSTIKTSEIVMSNITNKKNDNFQLQESNVLSNNLLHFTQPEIDYKPINSFKDSYDKVCKKASNIYKIPANQIYNGTIAPETILYKAADKYSDNEMIKELISAMKNETPEKIPEKSLAEDIFSKKTNDLFLDKHMLPEYKEVKKYFIFDKKYSGIFKPVYLSKNKMSVDKPDKYNSIWNKNQNKIWGDSTFNFIKNNTENDK